jgi:hypothetical protein
MMSSIPIPFGHAVSQRPQVVHIQGKGLSAISATRSSSINRMILRTLKLSFPLMGHAELQQPHCSQVLNISTSLNRSANAVLSTIYPDPRIK